MSTRFAIIVGLFLLFPISQMCAAETEECLLRYSLAPGEVLRYEVEHLANTNTRMEKTDVASSVRTSSTKTWRVTDVNDAGEMTFEHVIESVDMSQKNGEAEEVAWDSTTDVEPPRVFQRVADQLGQPIATIRINEQGQERERLDDKGTKTDLGMGGLTIPLPETPVKVGGQWAVPRQIRARTEKGEVKQIKIRELYTLEKLSAGVATITVRSEPLTPIGNAKMKSQVIQQLSNGTLRFDVDAGRLLSKQLDWDETVIGFDGADSMMEYRARLTEKLVSEPTTRTARRK
ncbi:hypothetical protein FF011L_19310 [Roseimaritima multifibrata]|uniref:Secreted protein n=1 Tax=Roseimaritima multifibrata TaxID=1930274 RepID=A0A517ME58_9BACT|nr:hypothetical protein [Roseimaritima multifibrata]QDS93172.1 hypothetical protein FF011L_19310 [Roseimaritima multifibrata]